jgi:hypothetical protein
MHRKFATRAAVAAVSAVLAAGGTALLGGTALAGGHNGPHDVNNGGNGGRGGHTTIHCEFHGPVLLGASHGDRQNLDNCGAIGTSNGAPGGSSY